jgi:hypothetical protein
VTARLLQKSRPCLQWCEIVPVLLLMAVKLKSGANMATHYVTDAAPKHLGTLVGKFQMLSAFFVSYVDSVVVCLYIMSLREKKGNGMVSWGIL